MALSFHDSVVAAETAVEDEAVIGFGTSKMEEDMEKSSVSLQGKPGRRFDGWAVAPAAFVKNGMYVIVCIRSASEDIPAAPSPEAALEALETDEDEEAREDVVAVVFLWADEDLDLVVDE